MGVDLARPRHHRVALRAMIRSYSAVASLRLGADAWTPALLTRAPIGPAVRDGGERAAERRLVVTSQRIGRAGGRVAAS